MFNSVNFIQYNGVGYVENSAKVKDSLYEVAQISKKSHTQHIVDIFGL